MRSVCSTGAKASDAARTRSRSPAARLRVAALLLASTSLSGCYSKITTYEGRFTLGYATGVQIENFVKPIAPGAKLDVVALANVDQKRLTITKAASSRPGVLAVEAVRDGRLTVKGVAPGVAEIEITAQGEGDAALTDRMFFHVGAPAVHGLEHACTGEPEAAWARQSRIDVLHGLATSDGRPVVGYGYAPLRVEPDGALELVAQPQAWPLYTFKAPAARARVTIRSTVDDRALSVRVVDRADLRDASLAGPARMLEGQRAYAVARVRLADAKVPLCSQDALTRARSLTPDVCRVTAKLEDEAGDENRDQLAEITALKLGVCRFEVTLPELAGGRGVVLAGETKIGRVEYPGERRAAAEQRRAWWTVIPVDGLAWLGGAAILASRAGVLAALGWWQRRRARGRRSLQ